MIATRRRAAKRRRWRVVLVAVMCPKEDRIVLCKTEEAKKRKTDRLNGEAADPRNQSRNSIIGIKMRVIDVGFRTVAFCLFSLLSPPPPPLLLSMS